jgi:hypothetical protein
VLPLLLPELLGGVVDGFPLLESGVVLGGFEFGLSVVLLPLLVDAPELLCPELPVVAELLLLLVPELSVVAELLLELLPLVEPELLMLPLWPDWSELCPEGDAVVEPLDPVDCPLLLPLGLLLCAIANAPAATNTKRIPGNFFIAGLHRV